MPKAMQKPTHYVSKEGGIWEPWPLGFLNTNDIKGSLEDLIALEAFPIAALKFSDGRVWDCLEGWLPTPKKKEAVATMEGWKIDSEAENIVGFRETIADPDRIGLQIPANSHTLGSSLHEAFYIINGERQDSYGNPENSFAIIAEYWSTYIASSWEHPIKLEAIDVAHMMMLFKIARCSGQHPKRDNYIDIQGYAAIAADRLIKEA